MLGRPLASQTVQGNTACREKLDRRIAAHSEFLADLWLLICVNQDADELPCEGCNLLIGKSFCLHLVAKAAPFSRKEDQHRLGRVLGLLISFRVPLDEFGTPPKDFTWCVCGGRRTRWWLSRLAGITASRTPHRQQQQEEQRSAHHTNIPVH